MLGNLFFPKTMLIFKEKKRDSQVCHWATDTKGGVPQSEACGVLPFRPWRAWAMNGLRSMPADPDTHPLGVTPTNNTSPSAAPGSVCMGWIMEVAEQNINICNTSELYTQKWIRYAILCHAYFNS